MKSLPHALTLFFLATLTGCISACSSKNQNNGNMPGGADAADSSRHALPDTLRVATLYSPTSYFIYRETPMGYHYSLVRQFCEDNNIALDLQVAPSMPRLIELLDSGKIDVAACELPVTGATKSHAIPCGPESITHQVLVQPKASDKHIPVTDVTQLVGREVYVEADSKYHHRLENLNKELGGGINIKPVARDTIITEDLITMVSQGKIPLTIVDSDIARINRTYYPDLDISLEISFPQRSAWGANTSEKWLADSIDAWLHQEKPAKIQAELLKQYFEDSKVQDVSVDISFSNGHMSPFDNYFRRYAREIGWDWRLLAAMGYTESQYDSTAVSWAGARGIMQIMPATARAYGLDITKIDYVEPSIATSAKIILSLDKTFQPLVSDSEERKKFIVAAYNSGPAHILDAIAIAKKQRMNPQQWIGSVENALMLKSKPEFYNDPVCRYGYFNGNQTYDYVRRVFSIYDTARKKVKAG